MIEIESTLVRLISFLPQSIFILFLLSQFFLFRYIPYVVVLLSEDLQKYFLKHEIYILNIPLIRLTIAVIKLPFQCSLAIWEFVSQGILAKDSNALAVAFLRHCFAGAPGPLSVDPKEIQFTRSFLTFNQRVQASVIRRYGAFQLFKIPLLRRGLAVVSRVNYLDKLFKEAITSGQCQQIVILGAGYDTRAYRFAEICSQKNVAVIEIDQPFVQQRKRRLLEKVVDKKSLGHVQFIPCKFDTTVALSQCLKQLNPDVNTFYIMEGVSPYLSKKEFETTVATLREFRALSRNKDVSHSIVFDIILKEMIEECQTSSALNLTRGIIRASTGHPEVYVSGRDDELKSEMLDLGFHVETSIEYQELLENELKSARKEDGCEALDRDCHFRAVFITAKIQPKV